MTIYHNDHLGTPQKLTTSSGVVVWSARYDAFGSATLDIHAVENNLRFPGQYYDAETGYHYNWNRYYDPEIGRYITVDPIGFAGGDVNLYGYCLNSPSNFGDPWGLKTWQEHVKEFFEKMGVMKDTHDDVIDAYKRWKDGKNAPCPGVSSVEGFYCNCIMGNMPDIEETVRCMCQNAADSDKDCENRLKKKIKELDNGCY